ncbi:protein of unknown function [Natronoarchaeum philippinense]|uniref:DUF4330 family protein n=1 Tax=Natronoarchaeum philippinense TaxID=558529 RepID=A0A285P246_NATPI|nr:DUF4330 family protein [Natronoarchaeum philippinense]SNZ15357.1 protein of unknown function [Natronoarchaeum philippinense]
MKILDENGNLFGRVNVVDALVVLVVLAVATAGATLVLGVSSEPTGGADGDSTPNTTIRYATLDLGNQPDEIVDGLETGDNMDVNGPSNLTITDVHATPVANIGNNKDTHLTIRARLTGTENSDGFVFGEKRLQLGQSLTLDTSDYSVKGSVTALASENGSIEIDRTPVVLETKLDAATSEAIEVGDEHRLKNETIATVRNVTAYPIAENTRRVFVGLELATIERGDAPSYAGQEVSLGTNVAFRTDAYDLAGTVVRRGSTVEYGDPTTTTATLQLESISPEFAESLEAGMAEAERNETLATIQSVGIQPAGVILKSNDGNIYLRDHPTKKDVTLTVELTTRQTDSTLRFHGRPIQEGNTITLDLPDRTFDAEITEFQ